MVRELTRPVTIRSQPGVSRDGTQFDRTNYIESLWCRWQRGLPRKMGGYRTVLTTLAEKIYGMHVYSSNSQQFAHMGSSSILTQVVMDQSGNLSNQFTRTPAGLTASADNLWTIDSFYDSVNGRMSIVAHAGQNLAAIDSTVQTSIFYGDMTASAALATSAMDPVSGGIVAVRPYLMAYGKDGRVDVSAVNNPTAVTLGSAYVSGSKIVAALPLRGSGSGPSAILWSLSDVIRATFDGSLSPVPFAFDTLSSQSSILSSRGPIEYDGVYYWPGVDRFMMFNGVVQELPNDYNANWFFDNVNMTHRQKVFAFKVPRFSEIWWCFPYGNATECTHAVVYNVKGRFWYDTQLPSTGRSAAYFAQAYSKPFMVDVLSRDASGSGLYALWQHESGVDAIEGTSVQPVRSYFKTSEISMLDVQEPQNSALRVSRMEPDFVQVGDMTVVVTGRDNARSNEKTSSTYTITESAATPSEETVPLKEVRRLMSFQFESNEAGGDYQFGKTIAHIGPADGRVQS